MARNFAYDPIDIQYIIDSGLLFEANRTVFHLFGIALTVKVDSKGNKSWDFKDVREEPEKAIFAPEVFRAGKAKTNKFLEEFGIDQIERRRKKLGTSCQSHVPEIKKEKK